MESGRFGVKTEGSGGPASNGVGLGWGQTRYLPSILLHPSSEALPCSFPQAPTHSRAFYTPPYQHTTQASLPSVQEGSDII